MIISIIKSWFVLEGRSVLKVVLNVMDVKFNKEDCQAIVARYFGNEDFFVEDYNLQLEVCNEALIVNVVVNKKERRQLRFICAAKSSSSGDILYEKNGIAVYNERNKGDVTLEDCHIVLRQVLNNSNYLLKSYNLNTVNQFAGYLGEYAVLQIKVIANNQEIIYDFFVKRMPKSSQLFKFLIECGGHMKEHGFYEKIVPKLLENGIESIKRSTTKCYLFKQHDFAIYDNLKTLGYVMLDKRKYLNYEWVKLTLKHLATFHGSFYVLEEKLSENDKRYRLIDEFHKELSESFYSGSSHTKQILEALVNGHEAAVDLFYRDNAMSKEEFQLRCKIFLNALVDFVKPSINYRNTLCHGDLWVANILYKDQNECKFVDYQTYRYLPPTHDVVTFLYITTNREFRKQHMQELLRYYYEELQSFVTSSGYDIETILPYDDYVNCCNYDKQFAICYSVSIGHVNLMKTETMEENLNKFEEEQNFSDRGDFIKNLCKNDPVSKDKIMESVFDLIELFNTNPLPILSR